MPVHVQTKTEIAGMLAARGIRPRRRFGQHFLIDGNLMRRLADCAQIEPPDTVLEIGGGTGGLTDLLVEAADRVVVVEIDRGLAGLLRERFADRAGFRLIDRDVLHSKNHLAREVVETVNEAAAGATGRVSLVANLPYSIATPLLINLLHELPAVTRFCFTVQRDVAEKIEAAPRTKAYGPLSVTLQAATIIRRIAQVGTAAFWPRPRVESSMLRLDVQRRGLAGPQQIARFTGLVREAFGHRRKTLRYNLARCLDEAALAVADDLLDLSRRPEDLSMEEWLELARRTVLRQDADRG